MKVLAIFIFLLMAPLFSATFYERLTPNGRQLYDTLDAEGKSRAQQLGEQMPNADQAVFLSAQEALSQQQQQQTSTPSIFNQQAPTSQTRPPNYNPQNQEQPAMRNMPGDLYSPQRPYMVNPGAGAGGGRLGP